MERSLLQALEQTQLKDTNKWKVRATLEYLSRSRLQKAFTHATVKEGFSLSGFCPFEPEVMLSNIRGWKDLDQKVKSVIEHAIPSVLALAA